MKKFLSFLLVLTMMVTAVPFVSAAEFPEFPTPDEDYFAEGTLADLIVTNPHYNGLKDAEVEVPTDMEVKFTSDLEYIDGPITTTASRVESIPTFGFQTTMYMDVVRDTFETYITFADILCSGNAAARADLANYQVKGGFTVKVYLPAGATFPEEMLETGSMVGFNPEAQNAFVDTSRVLSDDNVLTIEIEVEDKEAGDKILREGVMEADLVAEELETYLPDLTLTCDKVTVPGFGTHVIKGTVIGHTDLYTPETVQDPEGVLIGRVEYEAIQLLDTELPGHNEDKPESGIDETVIITREFSGESDPTPSRPVEKVEATYEVAGVVVETQSGVKPYTATPGSVKPEREGYIFDGWYMDPTYSEKVTEDKVIINENTTFYGRWINGTVPPAFDDGDTESGEHPAYIIGYPEGDVRPLRNITREEIATVFYRLMNDATRDSIFTDDNDFTDVEKDRWSNKAISTLANGGYINGYEDGSFNPAAAITRAEFITIAVRFSPDVEAWENVFSDVDGHWAEEYILKGIALGWITGYEDGTFRPDEYITRAEAMTIFNRVLVRYVNEEGLLPDAKYWIDNPADAWYYYQVEEATNSHTFVRQEDGYNEDWQTIEENQVWVEKGDLEDAE